MGDRLAAVAVVVPFLLGAMAAPDGDPEVVLRFRDPAIVESSGLVARADGFLTTNDSGDTGRVFLVDDKGTTVGVTTWAEEPVDVEALATGGPGHVWVGDIGDNPGTRSTVEVARVPVGRGDRSVRPETFSLVHPDGAVDAEALLRHPRTGRLYVVSKEVFGGRVYAAPARLRADRPNRLRAVGDAPPIVTDGAFFPDGRHLVLRDYGRAFVYSFPALARVAQLPLPDQQQGEGIAVDDAGRVYVSSEGRSAPVLEVPLPADLRAAVSTGTTPARTRAPETPDALPSAGARADDGPRGTSAAAGPVWPWVLGGALAVAAIGVLVRETRR